MERADKRAAAAVLRRVEAQTWRAVKALGNGGGWRGEERERQISEAVALGCIADALEDEARAEEEELEARAAWAERMATEPRGAF